jgi:hypothetical protein
MALALRFPALAGFLAFGLSLTSIGAFAQPAGTQMPGSVAAVEDGVVWLDDGSSFALGEPLRVTRIQAGTPGDLTPGQLVAISARRLADGTLDASLISVFPAGATVPTGQSEMTQVRFCEPNCEVGDLMTNATIDDAVIRSVGEGELAVSYRDETSTVLITQGTRVELQAPGSMDDVTPGAQVLGFVNPQGIAGTVWVYE